MSTVNPLQNDASLQQIPESVVTLDHADIARLAYEIFLARGCEPGKDVEDWLLAEHTLAKQQLTQLT